MAILRIALNQFSSDKKLISLLENRSIDKNHYEKAIWELINYRKDNLKEAGVRIDEG